MTSSDSSFEMIDVEKQDGPKYQEGEKSYYPSQIPQDSTDRGDPSAQEQLNNASHKPIECTSGVITEEGTINAPKVEELAENLMVATRENERLRTTMEGCNEALRKHVEAAGSKQQEMEKMKAMLDDSRIKIAELENVNKSLQDQLLASGKQEQGASYLTGETDHSAHDGAALLREQLAESTTEKEQLRMMNDNLRQSQSSLQYENEQLKQEKQKLMEEKKTQLDYFSSNEQLKSRISELQQETERLSLSQNDSSELHEENRKLKLKIESKDEEIARLQKDSFQQSLSEFQTLSSSSNIAERAKSNTRLMNRLEEVTKERDKLKRQLSDAEVEINSFKQNDGLLKKDKQKIQELQQQLDEERIKHEETQIKVRHFSNSSEDLEARRRSLETMHSQLTENYTNATEELRSARENLRMKEQELQANTQKQDELKLELETMKMNNEQLNERLNATSRNLDQALDSLKHHRQQSETISSRASETQQQLQQENESLNRRLEDGRVERDKLMEQLREAYGEKGKIERQFEEHVTASNETTEMLNQNITALQKHEAELEQEKERMLAHIGQMDANLKLSSQQLNETIRDYQMTVQDLETTVQRKKAIEGELHKLRGHYTQVNEERNQLMRAVDEKDKELKDLIDQRSKTVQEHSDTMELMRNQIQQYARDYEEERTARERFAQQMMKLQESVKQKDEEIDNLQGELTKYGGSRLRPAPDLNASMGGNSPYDRKSTMSRSGEKRHQTISESEDQRNDQQAGSKNLGSVSSQGSEDHVFTTASYPPLSATPRNQSVTMSHPYVNIPLNASSGGGAGISSGLPPPDHSMSERSFRTDIHQLQQPFNTPPGGGIPYRQQPSNQMNRSGEIRPQEFGDYNARSEALPPPHHQEPPIATNNLNNTGGGGDEGSTVEPCPICGKKFPTIEEVMQHAALCNF